MEFIKNLPTPQKEGHSKLRLLSLLFKSVHIFISEDYTILKQTNKQRNQTLCLVVLVAVF